MDRAPCRSASEALGRAIEAYGEVVGRAPSCVDALYGRATGRLRLGKLEADEGIPLWGVPMAGVALHVLPGAHGVLAIPAEPPRESSPRRRPPSRWSSARPEAISAS